MAPKGKQMLLSFAPRAVVPERRSEGAVVVPRADATLPVNVLTSDCLVTQCVTSVVFSVQLLPSCQCVIEIDSLQIVTPPP